MMGQVGQGTVWGDSLGQGTALDRTGRFCALSLVLSVMVRDKARSRPLYYCLISLKKT